jgi:3-deoxy-D-manno-octulosonate 8-phosphate phosphatase (KDO 8-P phosphatase)
MGDDLMDLPVLRLAGLSAAPADAADAVRERVDWVSRLPGGAGAVRELIVGVLAAQGLWPAIAARYLGDGRGAEAPHGGAKAER